MKVGASCTIFSISEVAMALPDVGHRHADADGEHQRPQHHALAVLRVAAA
jgi:hypothetical protein